MQLAKLLFNFRSDSTTNVGGDNEKKTTVVDPLLRSEVGENWEVVDAEQEQERIYGSFLHVLNSSPVDLVELRRLSITFGIPRQLRNECWRIMLGVLPSDITERDSEVEFHRTLYRTLLRKHRARLETNNSDEQKQTLSQIALDLPRTQPRPTSGTVAHRYFSSMAWKQLAENVLFVFSQHRPKLGYFQGMADLLMVLVDALLPPEQDLPTATLDNFEADCYWTFFAFMNRLQASFNSGQELDYCENVFRDGVRAITTTLQIVDPQLSQHLDHVSADWSHFMMRWLLCLLSRELSLQHVQVSDRCHTLFLSFPFLVQSSS
jgi:hypothetical protein